MFVIFYPGPKENAGLSILCRLLFQGKGLFPNIKTYADTLFIEYKN